MQKFYLSAYAKPSLGGLATGSATYGYGHWMPENLRDGEQNPVDTLRDLIENNSTLYMLAHSMFNEVPEKAPYDRDPTTLRKTKYFLVDNPNVPGGLIRFPFDIIVDWPMGTESGHQFFLDPRVNESLKAILNKWNEVLSNPNGRTGREGGGNQALIDAGWSSDEAVQQLEKKANDARLDSKKSFTELFEHPKDGTKKNFFN
ncbi:hypothetical protein ETB97_008576 [Aspergillus alliaceus]|uniref:L-tryptophan decarboxylase PsiD-like domain-containing protein n=1 Tax=Petromyces alliaceus TaxID=209559 RepID=A0A8H6E140_PETAA|nr:hypothetical protein ETB97_008576 [Aspergillus burnettii]